MTDRNRRTANVVAISGSVATVLGIFAGIGHVIYNQGRQSQRILQNSNDIDRLGTAISDVPERLAGIEATVQGIDRAVQRLEDGRSRP